MDTDWREELTEEDERVLRLCKKQPLWRFFRTYRHLLFDDTVVAALEAMHTNTGRGRPPKDARQKALAMLLQVVCHASDQEVPTLTAVDKRWQVVLGCPDQVEPLLSQGTVFNFRMSAISSGFMEVLLARTVTLARETKGFGHKRLRALIDSSPLMGAGRVEDSFNLIGRAISKLARTVAAELGIDLDAVAEQSESTLISASSVKAWLDIDWSDSSARSAALGRLVDEFDKLRSWLESNLGPDRTAVPPVSDDIDLVERLIQQDVEPDPDDPSGALRVRKGVAKDRQVSISDPDMRHGRKSTSKKFNGYKRHVLMDADIPGLIHATQLVPANATEAAPLPGLLKTVEALGAVLVEVHVDRGYITSQDLMDRRRAGLEVISKAPTLRNEGLFLKTDFQIDIPGKTITCPAAETIPIKPTKTGVATFPATTCAGCEKRTQCTTAKKKGRSIRIHPDEEFHQQLRSAAETPKGRQRARERIPVEHTLGRIGQVQGRRARYWGHKKNSFDLARSAVVSNCYVLGPILAAAA